MYLTLPQFLLSDGGLDFDIAQDGGQGHAFNHMD
jgi:hypothetical protein